ncbi:MAG: pectate lyase [Planctomycetes bacterium]|nr:pectate lyase [Planctomycetota bacterium]
MLRALTIILAILTTTHCMANPPARTMLAFPGAEGYGRFAQGGRGGDVYHVTNINDSGPGSLRQGLETCSGPRTIVFDVSGTIKLEDKLTLSSSNVTIAGQTAPGDGIALRDYTFNIRDCSDVIIRYIRVRLGDESGSEGDTINVSHARDTIFDHITSTWGVDGNMDTEYLSNFTLQWSIYGEALHNSNHHKGGHAMLMSFRKTSGNVSIHHNLLFSSRNRHPSLGGGSPEQCNKDAIFDFRNNVLYNWAGSTNLGIGQFNLINNYYRPGPSTNTDGDHYPVRPKVEIDDVTVGYMSGTVFEWNKEWSKDNHLAMQWGKRDGDDKDSSYPGNVTKEKFLLPSEPVAKADRPTTHSGKEAYKLVLDNAGDSLSRDAADRRAVKGIRDRTHRLIDSQNEVGGWPKLKSKPAPKDTDRDGMPDTWEMANNLDPNNPDDRNQDPNKDGYTNLEEYLNSLCPR